jgi:FtsP/CotA-like multicopper oxidase with cupredoxin domain
MGRLQARWIARALALAGALALLSPSPAPASVVDVWVAAVPTWWNVAPNGHDAIMGMPVDPAEAIFPTVVYRRYSPHWRRALPNADPSSADQLVIPGPLIRARVGDRLHVHFKNLDNLRRAPHSMHFHGVDYSPTSDGTYVPGFSGRDAAVRYGQSWTYELTAGPDSVGVWPYHDHSPSMMDSIHGGLFGMLSILGRGERAPDREFEVVFSPFGKSFMAIDGRAFVGNTPVFRSTVGQIVQWDVMAMGSDFHTFHLHGHRWVAPGGVPRDTQTVGPAESFRIRWREQNPGTWLYHCHVEDHMMRGMIGIYRVSRR